MTETPTPKNASGIRLLLLDVDGVLTDGRIVYGAGGEEIKTFDVRDGLGIQLAFNAGIHVGVVTGRRSPALQHRCRDLHIELIYDGIRDKAAAIDDIIAATGTAAEEIAFVGDDLIDLPAMKRVGLPVAVADAHKLVRQAAKWVTRAEGGRGAVRETIELILKSNGLWETAIEPYLR